MNSREVLQTYAPMYKDLSDAALFHKLSDIAYRQTGHGMSREYWKKAWGAKGYIKPNNIREHIENAIAEDKNYSDVAMAAGLKRYRNRQAQELVFG